MSADTRKRNVLSLLSICSIILFFASWEMAVRFEMIPNSLLASPSQVCHLLVDKISNSQPDGAILFVHLSVSLQEALTGYILALLVGIPLGLLMGWYNVIEGVTRPIFELIRPIPAVAWIPLTIFWFGIGISGKIFIIFLSGIVPCVINSFVGVRLTNPSLIQMAKTYGGTKWQIFTKICIPSALPMIFGALQIALAACWTALVAAELLAADSGLGFLITMGRRLTRPDLVVLGMLLVGLTGFAVGKFVDYVEKKLLASIRR